MADSSGDNLSPFHQPRNARLKEVSVPPPSFKMPSKRASRSLADEMSRTPSVNGSIQDQSTDYETPDTSVVMTPADSIARTASNSADPMSGSGRPAKGRGISAAARAQQLRQSAFASSSTRKRQLDDFNVDEAVDDSPDARLARALQAEEYEKTDLKRPKLSNARSKQYTFVGDSDEEDLEDSDKDSDEDEDISELDDEEFASSSRRPSAKRVFRPARPSTKSSLKSKPSITIPDSDDEDLSELQSVDLESELDVDYSGATSDADSDVLRGLLNALSDPEEDGDAAGSSFRPFQRSARAVQSGLTRRAMRERKKLEKAHPQVKTMWDDLAAIPKITPTRAAQPASITRRLKPFQLEGLNWMTRQEQTHYKGGLLGDEMGMGKTIQAVSLIMSDYPAKNPTLVVVPPVALMQWQSEIKEYTNGKLNVIVYHGSNSKVKHLTKKDLKKYDVIMISYAGLESLYRKEQKGWKREDAMIKEDSVIHSIHFHRLILDEAHSIKTRTTSVARACFALKGDYKWCLSGTPVQNRIGEFFSLLRFLEVKPFACYFCKSCDCAELHWSQDVSKRCTHCQHRGFEHVSVFNQELLNPITQAESPAVRKEALAKLRLITDRIMLRRMKRDHTSSMELPPKEVIIHNEFFGEIERDFSSSIMSNTTRKFDTYVSQGVMLNNYANIFGLIMQMRQVANHPDLILKKHSEGGQNVLVCSICDEPAEEPIRSRCHHEFCRKCAKDYVKSFEGIQGGDPDCPRCHISLSIDFEQPDIEQEEETVKKNSIINRIKMEDWTSSTKIEMLVYDLYKLRSKKQTQKSIIFSQFTSMLQLIEWRLRRAGFNTVMLDGSMSPAQRAKSIDYFMNNVNVEVFLVSLKAGGVALNLTEASRVFIVDP